MNKEKMEKFIDTYLHGKNVMEDDHLRLSFLIANGVYPELLAFLENEILTNYDESQLKNNHDRNHIFTVLVNAYILSNNIMPNMITGFSRLIINSLENINMDDLDDNILDTLGRVLEKDFVRDFNKIITAVYLHDIGLCKNILEYFPFKIRVEDKIMYEFAATIPNYSSGDGIFENVTEFRKYLNSTKDFSNDDIKDNHHITGYIATRYYFADKLKRWFTSEEIKEIAMMVYEHRASRIDFDENTSYLSKILSQADRCFYYTKPEDFIKRMYLELKIKNPLATMTELAKMTIEKCRAKVGENGYAYKKIEQCYPDDSGYKRFKEEAIKTLSGTEDELNGIILAIELNRKEE